MVIEISIDFVDIYLKYAARPTGSTSELGMMICSDLRQCSLDTLSTIHYSTVFFVILPGRLLRREWR